MTIAAIVNKGCLQGRFYTGDFRQIYVTADAVFGGGDFEFILLGDGVGFSETVLSGDFEVLDGAFEVLHLLLVFFLIAVFFLYDFDDRVENKSIFSNLISNFLSPCNILIGNLNNEFNNLIIKSLRAIDILEKRILIIVLHNYISNTWKLI